MISKWPGTVSWWLISVLFFTPIAQAQLQPEQARAEAEMLEAVAANLDALAGSAAPAGDMTQATEQLNFEAESIIAFVRDSIGFEPYSGTLKGARGCLSARACNALDQALLLATLLKDAGYDARISRGSLGESETLALARASLVEVEEPAMVADIEKFELTMSKIHQAKGAPAMPKAAPPDQTGVPSANVMAVAERLAGLVPLAENEASIQKVLTDYFWVEWREAAQDEWAAVHPAFGSETPPTSIKVTEFFADSIPDAFHHRLRFEMGIESLESGRLVTKQIMTPWERPVANFFGNSVSLGVVPLGDSAPGQRPDTFVALLNGSVANGASAFSLTGQLIDLEAAGDAAAGLFKTVSEGFLGAAGKLSGNDQDQPLMALTGQFIRVTWIRPDGKERTEERWLLDRLANRGGDEAPRIDPKKDVEHVANTLVYLRTILVQPAGEHAAANLRRSSEASASRIRWSKELIEMVDWAEARVAEDRKTAPSLDQDHPLLLSLSTLTHHPVRVGDTRTTWRDGPFVASVHEMLDPHLKTKAWVDILFNPWRGGEVDERGLHPWPQGSFVRGVLDTAWESAVVNPSLDYLAGDSSAIALLTNAATAEQDRDQNEGFILASVPYSAGTGPRWWRIHPETGEILGMSALGGSVSVEYVVGLISVGVSAFLMGRSVGTCAAIDDGTQRACCFVVAAGFSVSGAAGITAGVLAAPVGMTVGAALGMGVLQLKSMLVLDAAQSLATDAACG